MCMNISVISEDVTKTQAMLTIMIKIVHWWLWAQDTQFFGIAGADHSRREGEGDVFIAFGSNKTVALLNCEELLNDRTQLAGETTEFDGEKIVGSGTISDVVTLGLSVAA